MFVICTPSQSEAMHEELRKIGQEMYTDLGLHFKVSSRGGVDDMGRRCAQAWLGLRFKERSRRFSKLVRQESMCRPRSSLQNGDRHTEQARRPSARFHGTGHSAWLERAERARAVKRSAP